MIQIIFHAVYERTYLLPTVQQELFFRNMANFDGASRELLVKLAWKTEINKRKRKWAIENFACTSNWRTYILFSFWLHHLSLVGIYFHLIHELVKIKFALKLVPCLIYSTLDKIVQPISATRHNYRVNVYVLYRYYFHPSCSKRKRYCDAVSELMKWV